MAAGCSIALVSVCYVDEKTKKESNFGKRKGANVLQRWGVRDLKGGRAPFEPDSKVLGWQTRKFEI